MLKRMVGTVAILMMVVALSVVPVYADTSLPLFGIFPGVSGGTLAPFMGVGYLLGIHDCLTYGCTINPRYVEYQERVNNAWRTQKHYDKFGVEYTPKEDHGWSRPEQEAYYRLN